MCRVNQSFISAAEHLVCVNGRSCLEANPFPCLSVRYSMCAMSWGEVELEPEVRDWSSPSTRVTYWIAPGRGVILLTVFSKTRWQERVEVGRAKRAMERSMANNTLQVRSDPMSKRTDWEELKASKPLSEAGRAAYEDEARIAAFRELVFRLRTEAELTQAELAQRMGTTQSAIARMEGGGTRPTLDTLEKLAAAVGRELVVGVGERLSENPTIAKLVQEGHAVVSSRS